MLDRSAGVLALVLLTGCTAEPSSNSIAQRFIPALLKERFTIGRLAHQTTWRACTTARNDTSVVPRTHCQTRSPDPAKDADRNKRWQSVLSAKTSTALRARALSELKWHEFGAPALDRAIAFLEEARKLAPADPVILNDLAVAHIELAERTQELTPMLRALDLVERALEQDSMLLAARFNRALIMERLYLMESAGGGWARYKELDPSSEWHAEADQHARAIAQLADTTRWDLATFEAAPPNTARSFVQLSPQRARDFVYEVLLPEWGQATVMGDQRLASRLLTLASEIARGFEAMQGDRSISLALDAIERAPANKPNLARAHIAFGEGLRWVKESAWDSSAVALGIASTSLRSLGTAAAGWAAYYQAGAEVRRGNYALANAMLGEIRSWASSSEPALIGKVVWQEGVVQARLGNYENATLKYREAAPHIARANELENLGAISYLLSETLVLGGQSDAGRAEAYRGLKLLSLFRRSSYLNSQLINVAALARADAMPHAALAVMNEVIPVARSTGKADVQAWSYRARARDLIHLERTAEAQSDLTRALQWADSVKDGMRARADVQMVRAELELRTDPRAALDLLTSVVAAYRKLNLGTNLPNALHAAARAAKASNNWEDARLYLEQAIQQIERQRASFQSAESRAMLYETVERVFDEVIELVHKSDADAAFDYLERNRAAARSLGEAGTPARRNQIARARKAIASDKLLIEYALLPDKIAIWTISSRRDSLYLIALPRDSVAALTERFGRETNLADPSATQARAALFEVLIRPLQRELTDDIKKLAIVPDRELHAIPFVSLWDSLSKQYLIATYEVRTIPSADFLVEAGVGRASPGDTDALIVGNPAIDSATGLQLPSLTHATEEARSIAQHYQEHTLLLEGQARLDTVLALLPKQAVFHFAGHAVFNTEQPERSYLALAPGRANPSGKLEAREIGNLRLSNVKLVVLAACSTLNPRTTRVGVVAGLAHSFLRAGVPSIVSSLWNVSDDATAELLVDFHQNFARTGDAAQALRAAQLEALQDPARRAIQNWAGFIYTGH